MKTPRWQLEIVRWIIPNLFLVLTFIPGYGMLSRLFRTKLFKVAGDISFECYLIHYIVIMTYDRLCIGAVSWWGNFFSLAFCFGLTILSALFIHYKKS